MFDWAELIRRRLIDEGATPAPHRDEIDELAAHLADTYQTAIRGGADVAAARRAAEAELDGLGPIARALERRHRFAAPRPRTRDRLRAWTSDLRPAVRLLRVRPAFAAIVCLTLAIGIGLTVAVFSMYEAVLGRALPYPRPAELVLIWSADAANRTEATAEIVSAPTYEDWRTESQTMSSLGIWEFIRANISGGGDPDQVQAARASASLFTTIGVDPALGRTFTADEDAPGHRVVVISDGVWRSQFSADPDVLGRSLRVNELDYTVIGVMPASFAFPRATTSVWIPIALTPGDHDRTSRSFMVVGRLASGVSVADADAEFGRIGAVLATRYPESAGESSVVTSLPAYGMQSMQRMLGTLALAVALVLLIACVNVSNLQIGLAFARRREFLVRLALGAGTRRLARQLFAEGLALATVGGAAGVALAWVLTRALDSLVGPGFFNLPFRTSATIGIDGRAVAFAAAVAFGCALLFSFAPLFGWRRASTSASAALQDGARGVTRSALGVRRLLVAAEMAMAIAVLAGAGVLVKSFGHLLDVNSGLDPERVVGMQVSVPQKDTYGRPERTSFCEDITRAAAPGPGRLFRRFGAISHLPLSGANAGRGLAIDGWSPPTPDAPSSASFRVICPGYFETLGIPIIAGRDIAATDREPFVVVNAEFADRYWPQQNPIGRRIRITYGDNPWMTVIGVAGNVHHFGLDSQVAREIFVPYRLNVWPSMTLVAKTSADITPAAERALREVIRDAYPALPAGRVWTMGSVVGDSLRTRSSLMQMLLIFAAVGLALSAIGVYGVLAYYVTQRTRELGVRVALGSSRARIVGLVLHQAAVPVIAGGVIGAIASLWTNRLLADALFETTPGDPVVLTAITVLVVGIGILASWIPAHRAAGVDPTIALRD